MAIDDDFDKGMAAAVQAANAAKQRMGVAAAASEPAPGRRMTAEMTPRALSFAIPPPPLQVVPAPTAERPDEHREARALARATRAAVEVVPAPYRGTNLDYPSALVHRVKNMAAIAKTLASVGERFVVWQGAPGTGKTTLACAALERRIRSEVGRSLEWRPCYTAEWKLAGARARFPLGEGDAPAIEAAMKADLLLIDDVGDDGRDSHRGVRDVIFDRYERGAPTWYTTAFSDDALAERYGAGIARRIFELDRSVVIRCNP